MPRRLLLIGLFPPKARPQNGFDIRTQNTLLALSSLGAEVDTFWVSEHVSASVAPRWHTQLRHPLTPLFAAQHFHPARLAALQRQVDTIRYDAVVFDCLEVFLYFRHVRLPPGTRSIFDMRDATSRGIHQSLSSPDGVSVSLPRRAVNSLRYLAAREMERSLLRRAGRVVLLSEVDRDYIGAPEIAIAKNAVAVPATCAGPVPALASPAILFVADFAYRPNFEAFRFLVEQIAPRLPKGISIRFVGRNADRLTRPPDTSNIEIVGEVEDLSAEFAGALCVAAPLFFGTGVKNKVLEAMAFGKTVIGTAIANDGIDAKHGREFLEFSSAGGFVAAVTGLIADPDRAQTIGQAARALIQRKFSVEAVRNQWAEALDV